MDAERLASLVRSLSTTPTRRAVNRALLTLVAGTALAPMIEATTGDAKRKRRKKKRKKRRPCIESHNGTCHPCAPQDEYCPIDKTCCSWEKREWCSSCGCCPENFTLCCVGADDKKWCCEGGSQCCGNGTCCSAGSKCCNGGGCCKNEDVCCATTNGTHYCCSGADGLTCLKTGGNTCVKA
jgi:hypothetical protein